MSSSFSTTPPLPLHLRITPCHCLAPLAKQLPRTLAVGAQRIKGGMLATLAPLRPLRLPPEIYRPTLASGSPDLSVSPAVQLGPVHRAQLTLLDGSAAGVDAAGQRGCLGLAISNVAARIVAARPEFDGLRFVDHQLRSAVARNWRNRDTALSSSFASILRSSARVNMAVISSSNHCRSRSSKAMKCAGLKLSNNFDSNVSVAIGLQAVAVRGRRAPRPIPHHFHRRYPVPRLALAARE
jgi:hypothetical protein